MSPLNQLAVSQVDPLGPPEPSKPSKKLVACAFRCRPAASSIARAPLTMELIMLVSSFLGCRRDQGVSFTVPTPRLCEPVPVAALITSIANRPALMAPTFEPTPLQ